VLLEGQRRGLLGPGPIAPQIAHALEFAEAAGGLGEQCVRALDLGSGGGLPGLALAAAHPETAWTLLDSRRRSVDFLHEAVEGLDLAARVDVLEGRAEEVGRAPAYRGQFQLVTARGFGPPAVTAECAASLLAVGGRLVVSEPPGSVGERWPARPLEQLGVRLLESHRLQHGGFAVLEQVSTCPETYPRRTGVPAKRPLFVSRETSATT
jgi:16S rRNA (guanine527-N7)-methyltransferase